MEIQAALIKSILEKHQNYEWTRQGFGFVRTKIGAVGRIHVWDSTLTAARVSTIHNHPWVLKSTIISGELINQRMTEASVGMPYCASQLKTGEGGGLTGETRAIALRGEKPEFYSSGETYEQEAAEIHRTIARDGTVTLLERMQGPPLEVADTYWPQGSSWVSAEPTAISGWELQKVIDYALSIWAIANTKTSV